jgi:hypothetical protein
MRKNLINHNLPKKCNTCNIVKNAQEFYTSPKVKTTGQVARQKNCIPCHNKIRSDRKKEMGEEWHKKENKRKKEWATKNPERQHNTSKNARLKRMFGIDLQQYNELLISQNKVCAICKKEDTGITKSGKQKELAVDHYHSTGEVRGLLCFHCNSSLGKLKDSVDLLQNAIDYLKNSRFKKETEV